MHSCIQGCCPIFVPVVDVNSPFNEIERRLDGPAQSLLFGEQFFARMVRVGDVLCLDEQTNGAVVDDMDVDGMAVGVLDEEVDLGLVEEIEGHLVVLGGVLVGVHVVVVGLDQAPNFP